MSEQERFEAYLRDTKFPVLPVWRDGSPYQNYALEVMWKSWQASRRAALEEAAQMFDALGKDLAASQVRALAASDSEGGNDD